MRGVRICSNVKILLSLGVALDTLMSYANHEESEEFQVRDITRETTEILHQGTRTDLAMEA